MNDVDYDEDEQPARYPFNLWGQACNVVQFLAAVAGNASTFLSIVASDLAAANNHSVDRRKQREGRRLLIDDLESLERGERP